jgi:hypothetical protein
VAKAYDENRPLTAALKRHPKSNATSSFSAVCEDDFYGMAEQDAEKCDLTRRDDHWG